MTSLTIFQVLVAYEFSISCICQLLMLILIPRRWCSKFCVSSVIFLRSSNFRGVGLVTMVRLCLCNLGELVSSYGNSLSICRGCAFVTWETVTLEVRLRCTLTLLIPQHGKPCWGYFGAFSQSQTMGECSLGLVQVLF